MATLLVGQNLVNVRLGNRSAVLSSLLRYGPISRSRLSRMLNLNPATVTHIVRELIEQGLIAEVGTAQLGLRRRPGPKETMLEVDPNGAYAVGVHFGMRSVAVALVNSRAEILGETWLEERGDMPNSAILAWVRDEILALASRHGVDMGKVVGVGVDIADIADPAVGTHTSETDRAWQGEAPGRFLSESLSVPVLVDSTAPAMALAETWFGAGQDTGDLVLLWVGNIVCCGIVINHRIYRGHQSAAGRIEHTRWDPNGVPCRCGRRGCLKTRVTESAMARRGAAAATPGSVMHQLVDGNLERLSWRDVVTAAHFGDPSALQIVREIAVELGLVVADLAALLNPRRVVLSGRMLAAAGELMIAPLRDTVRECLVNTPAGDVEIVSSRFGRSLVLVGAASLPLLSRLYAAGQPEPYPVGVRKRPRTRSARQALAEP